MVCSGCFMQYIAHKKLVETSEDSWERLQCEAASWTAARVQGRPSLSGLPYHTEHFCKYLNGHAGSSKTDVVLLPTPLSKAI